RGGGTVAEALPMPGRKSTRLGRRQTSGKECLPMCLTLGGVLQRLEAERDSDEHFAVLLPKANGPCRFGCYSLLHRSVLDRLGWAERVRIWSPNDEGYFEGLSPGATALAVTSLAAMDMLLEGLYDTRPRETRPGAAQSVYDAYEVTLSSIIWEISSGRLFGCSDILKAAARDFAHVRAARDMPTVMVVGEIYVRADPFANDFIVEKLERRGLRVRFAPLTEWLEYTDICSKTERGAGGMGGKLSSRTLLRIQNHAYRVMASELGWPRRTSVADTLKAAAPYVRRELNGEAVLTVGGPVHEWRHALIDGVVNVGPLECMPGKIAEAQFFYIGEQEGLPSLSISYNGDPLDPEIVDNFAFEIHQRFRRKSAETARSDSAPTKPAEPPTRPVPSYDGFGRPAGAWVGTGSS
ncbi:MAG: CoA activase, partial [Planctomycetota bacterium]